MTARRDLIRRYTLTVWITVPCESEPWSELTADERRPEMRELERSVITALRRVEGDADVEVIDAEDVAE